MPFKIRGKSATLSVLHVYLRGHGALSCFCEQDSLKYDVKCVRGRIDEKLMGVSCALNSVGFLSPMWSLWWCTRECRTPVRSYWPFSGTFLPVSWTYGLGMSSCARMVSWSHQLMARWVHAWNQYVCQAKVYNAIPQQSVNRFSSVVSKEWLVFGCEARHDQCQH